MHKHNKVRIQDLASGVLSKLSHIFQCQHKEDMRRHKERKADRLVGGGAAVDIFTVNYTCGTAPWWVECRRTDSNQGLHGVLPFEAGSCISDGDTGTPVSDCEPESCAVIFLSSARNSFLIFNIRCVCSTGESLGCDKLKDTHT